MSSDDREPNEIWEEIRRAAWLVKRANIDDLSDALVKATLGERALEPNDLDSLLHGFADARILVRLLEEFDRSQGCDGIDSSATDGAREELWGPSPGPLE